MGGSFSKPDWVRRLRQVRFALLIFLAIALAVLLVARHVVQRTTIECKVDGFYGWCYEDATGELHLFYRHPKSGRLYRDDHLTEADLPEHPSMITAGPGEAVCAQVVWEYVPEKLAIPIAGAVPYGVRETWGIGAMGFEDSRWGYRELTASELKALEPPLNRFLLGDYNRPDIAAFLSEGLTRVTYFPGAVVHNVALIVAYLSGTVLTSALLLDAILRALRLDRLVRRRCPRCTYDLRAIVDWQCPECGYQLTPGDQKWFGRPDRREAWPRSPWPEGPSEAGDEQPN